MTNYELKQNLLQTLRTKLKNTPLTFGSITINNIFRKYDKKTIETNYYQINIVDTYYKEPNYNEIRVDVDCYAENEIMVDRFRESIKKYLDELVTREGNRIVNVGKNLGVDRLDTRRYVGRVSGYVYFYTTCN